MVRGASWLAGHRFAAVAFGLAACVVAIFLVRSKLFGVYATPGDSFPIGFAGRLLGPGLDGATMSILGSRDDGTPILTQDVIRFEDAVEGVIEMPRPAVSLAEAERLGHDPKWRTPLAISAYGMRGPVSAGFTGVDARWVIETAKRHENPEARAKAVTLIAFAVTSRETTRANSYSDQDLREMVGVFESALLSTDESVVMAALGMSDWQGWAELSDTYVESLVKLSKAGRPEHADRASYVLLHTFGAEGPR